MPGPAGLPTSRPARPASEILSSRIASAASSTPLTATASASPPSAAASAASWPGATVSSPARLPSRPGHLVGAGQQRAGAVLAAQAHARAPPRGPSRWPRPSRRPARRRPAPGRRPAAGSCAATASACRASRSALSRSASVDSLGDRVQLGLGLLGPGQGVGVRGGEPVDLLAGAGGPGPGRVDLAGEPGQPLPPVGDRLGGGDQLPLGGGELPFQLLPVLDRLGEPDLVVGERRAQLLLLLADPLRLGVQLLRVAAGPLVVAGGAEVPQPLPGELLGGAEPLLQRGELVPGVLRGGEQRRVLGERRLQLAEPALHLGVLGLDLLPPLPQRGLVGDLLVQRGPQGGQVVGEQPQPGVAQVGLDGGGPPGHLGLPAQRLELAAQLGGEVGQPVEVGLHRVELAQRLFLALAVLEDAGRLLDERPAVLRLGVQHAVELALADDDVHLPADAGVARAAPGCRAAGRSRR